MGMSAVDLYKREQALNFSKPKNATQNAAAQQTAQMFSKPKSTGTTLKTPASSYAAAAQGKPAAPESNVPKSAAAYDNKNNNNNQKKIDEYHKSMMGKGSVYVKNKTESKGSGTKKSSSNKSSSGSNLKGNSSSANRNVGGVGNIGGGGSSAVSSGGAAISAAAFASSGKGGATKSTSKKSGINSKAAKKAYNDLGTYLNSLVNHLNKLVTDVQELNKNVWYGGAKANSWYTNLNNRYNNVYKYCNGINEFRTSLGTVFKKAKANGIDFG